MNLILDLKVEVCAFTVPTSVHVAVGPSPRQDGFRPAPTMPLSALSAENLATLCDTFRAAVFEVANKKDPRLVTVD